MFQGSREGVGGAGVGGGGGGGGGGFWRSLCRNHRNRFAAPPSDWRGSHRAGRGGSAETNSLLMS